MTQRSIIKMALVVFSLVLFCNVNASAQKMNANDKEIVKSIYAKIKEKYPNQMRTVNVVSKNGAVTLEGCTPSKKIRGKIEKIAKDTANVVKDKLVNKLKSTCLSGGCDRTQKQCGDICIDKSQTCNLNN